MNCEGRWDGISSDEALCRIEVMSRNSNMFLDSSHDEIIEKARTSYCKSILESLRCFNGVSSRSFRLTLFLLYEMMMWGVGVPDYELVNEIADSSRLQAAQYPYGSDEWLFYQSICLDRLCMQVSEEIQQRMLANIA